MKSSPFEKLFTPVEVVARPGLLRHGAPVLTLGSCFAEEVGERLLEQLFDVEVNPFGALYNPVSVVRALDRVISGKEYTAEELICNYGRWKSFDFHSKMSGNTPQEALEKINTTICRLNALLPRLELLIITLGSARGFKYLASGKVVGNCHKLPTEDFEIVDLDIDVCRQVLSESIEKLRRVAPKLEIILTVSPVRHKSYGLHSDRLSKATLLLAADELCRRFPGVDYFPAYEIMQDELRDYRFYASDMVHPSAEAVEWITRRFIDAYADARTADAGLKLRKKASMLRHRPFSGSNGDLTDEVLKDIPDECVKPLMRLSRRYDI